MCDIKYAAIEATAFREKTSEIETVEHVEVKEVEGWAPSVTLEIKEHTETGEERDTVLFEGKSKLHRWRDEQWKERGVGVVKILKSENGRVRFIMRQKDTLKIIANHYVRNIGNLCALQSVSGKLSCWTWMAPDFSGEETRIETYYIRLSSEEIANTFREVFTTARNCDTTDGDADTIHHEEHEPTFKGVKSFQIDDDHFSQQDHPINKGTQKDRR